MNWKILKTEQDYTKVSNRITAIFNAIKGTPEADELELLIVLVQDYDDKHFVLPTLSPLDAIKYKMDEKGIKANDLEPLIGSKRHVSSILSGRRGITLKIAQKAKKLFSVTSRIVFANCLKYYISNHYSNCKKGLIS